ncbi:MerR family redox-sensitive transcriptional activator SoxR [Streptomyces aurantiacus]|uniref:MerR family transcriptional regulator n=1 Tax=Streptomyces aurantiacus TaxID=47760 RepID=UPI002793A39B|nr:MerR family transcriptional regulator [Streptomyces aurantiacus]MDQ0775432.1 MerR family redox-sensitive transcriptional activator SoxR [Streptomyces aurantiacus]
MRIGEVAAEAGVSTRVLRYYEQQQLLTSTRTPAGHREYGSAAVERVQLIQLFYEAGLSSRAIRALLPSVEAGEATPEVLQLLAAERQRMEQRIAGLLTTRNRLEDVIEAAVDPHHDCVQRARTR